MRVYTRIKERVDAIAEAELHCTVCDNWKLAKHFYARTESNRALRYEKECKQCKAVYSNARKTVDGRKVLISRQELRDIVRGGYSTLAGALNQARHPQREITPLTPEELKLRREKQEAKEREQGKPDLCYLVGMEGDDTAVKIGHSTNPPARLGEYQAGNPRKLMVLATIDGGKQRERELHQRFIRNHQDWMVGEWFAKDPAILNEFKVTI
jgi:hypothetical protein